MRDSIPCSHVLGHISPISPPFFLVFCAYSPPRRDGSNEPQAGTQGQETAGKGTSCPSTSRRSSRIIGAANILCCLPTLIYDSPRPREGATSGQATEEAGPAPGADAEALTARDPRAWRRMVTGRASQSEPGGQWQLWALWYSFFCLYASAEIGFSAWISPYATLLDLAVSASAAAPATHLPNAQQ